MKLNKYAVIMTASLLMASAMPSTASAAENDPPAAAGTETAGEETVQIIAKGDVNADVTWQLDENGTLLMTGSGDMSKVDSTLEAYRGKIRKAVITSKSSEEPLTGIGANLFRSCTLLTEVTLPDTVTAIGSSAFNNCTSLSSINFPAALTSVGSYAFVSTALTDITLPGCSLGEYAFQSCPSLKTVTIGEGTEIIPGHCFSLCIALESVVLPDSVKEINRKDYDNTGAFFNCPALTKVSIGKGIESIDKYAFRTTGEGLEVTFREGVKAIPANSFTDRGEVAKLILPSTLETIGSGAFSGCVNLSVCSFPDSLTEIGAYGFNATALTEVALPGCSLGEFAFQSCTALKTVTIGEGTEIIPGHCFSYCTALESVVLPDSVKKIERKDYDNTGAFFSCPALTKVSIGKGIESIDKYAFRTTGEGLEVTFREGVKAIPANSFTDRGEVAKLILPSTLETIGSGAFSGCVNLSVCSFPDSLTEIGAYGFNATALTEVALPGCSLGEFAFQSCTALKTVTIGEGTEIIPGHCFSYCTALESVILPDSVKKINRKDYDNTGAFFNCPALTKVSIGKGIESIDKYAFRTTGEGLEVTFREGVKAIPANSFTDRGEVAKLILPSTLETIGSGAFSGCENLSVCSFPDSLTEIGNYAFSSTALTELSLPGCILGEGAFHSCASVKTLVIGEGTEIIPGHCFSHCTALESVVLPDSVKEINRKDYDNTGAFFNCPALTKVSIGKGIESIDKYAFRTTGEGLEVTFREGVKAIPANSFTDRGEVAKLILPSTLETIGSGAFSGCENLSVCSFPDSLTEIGNYAFSSTALTELSLPGCILGEGAFHSCASVKTLVIGEGTEIIPGHCFSHCTALESVVLPDSVKEINRKDYDNTGAFFNCPVLTKVSIGKGIESIDKYAFRTTGEKLEVIFREGVTAVPAGAFTHAPLTSVILPETVKSLGSGILSGYSSLETVSVGAEDCDIADSEKTIPSSALIKGFEESTAHKYAEKYGRAFKAFENDDPTIMYGCYVSGISLTLDGSIGVNFFANLKKGADKVVLNGPCGEVVYSGEKLAAALQKDGRYKFSYGVNATQAGQIITMKIYDTDGKQLDIYNSSFEKLAGMKVEYSVNTYIGDVAKYQEDQKLDAMVKALDTYCKAAENYFCRTSHVLDIPTADIVRVNDFGKKFKISLVLYSCTALRIYSDAKSAVQISGGKEHALEAVKLGDKVQYFEIPNIYAQQLTSDITVILDGETYKISPMDYCAMVLKNKDADKKLTDVCNALYYYGEAAKAYKNK